MFYEGKEKRLWVDFDEEIMDPVPDNGKIIIPVLNEPYNRLVYSGDRAELWNYDYDEDILIQTTPCVLSPMERENILRLYYPILSTE